MPTIKIFILSKSSNRSSDYWLQILNAVPLAEAWLLSFYYDGVVGTTV